MQVLINMKVLVAQRGDKEQRVLFWTADWKREGILEYARKIGLKPLYIVNVKDKRYE